MEISGNSGTLNLLNSSETNHNNKADCYFYYYSSCNKGNSCPYRHEPAALRNETMCLYWLKGSCNKPHCIYRHMEITKKRDTIPCFFESQPGGCKKLHCPFFHNSLDRPKDEDVPKNLGLILPVKDSEAEYETEESEIKKIQEGILAQLKIQRQLSQSQGGYEMEDGTESPSPLIVRRSFIVPLVDGESDSEGGCGSPEHESNTGAGRHWVLPEPGDWELERLKEIQKQEGDILGYSFASSVEDAVLETEAQLPDSPLVSQYSYEENVDIIEPSEHEDYSSQTIIKRSFTSPEALPAKLHGNEACQEAYVKKVFGSVIKDGNKAGQDAYVKRVCGSIIKEKTKTDLNSSSSSTTRRAPSHMERKFDTDHDTCSNFENNDAETSLRERLWLKGNSIISIKERLGKRRNREAQRNVENEPEGSSGYQRSDDSVKSRLGLRTEGNERLNLREGWLERQDRNVDFVVKSLSDIKAEKEREKIGTKQLKSSVKIVTGTKQLMSFQELPEALPLSAVINRKKDNAEDVESIQVKTLAEIKAEKEKKMPLNSADSVKATKRHFSPIRFDLNSNKKGKPSENSAVTVGKTVTGSTNPLGSFSSRKLTVKKVKNTSVCSAGGSDTVNVNNRLSSSFSRTCSESSSVKATLNGSSSSLVNKECRGRDTLGVEVSDLDVKSRNKCFSRLDSFIDEDELLLLTDTTNQFDDEDINEDELLL